MLHLLLTGVMTLTSWTWNDGREHARQRSGGQAHVKVFVTSDCPLSNYYAPEIQGICDDYRTRGLTCALVYEDLALDEAQMHRHLEEYRYRGIPASIDRDRSLARRSGATVTPEAVLFDRDGRIRYRGRIDNRYEAFGKPRRVVTARNLRDAINAVLDGRPVTVPEAPALGCHIVFPNPERKHP